MSKRSLQLVVVGGGPAGLSAATIASRFGMAATVVEESRGLGGQYFRGREESLSVGSPRFFLDQSKGVQVLTETAVIDSPGPGLLTLFNQDQGVIAVSYDVLVLATGARERMVALPGWTLPGVFTAGAISALARTHKVTPGKRVLIAGSGPFLFSVARDLMGLGCQVQVVEATPFKRSLGGLRIIPGDPRIIQEILMIARLIVLRRVPVKYGAMVTQIQGAKKVEAVRIQRVDKQWHPIRGSEISTDVDAVCMSFGFLPQIELAQLIGCRISYDEETAAFYVWTDGSLRTTLRRVYAAGEVTGIGGYRSAALEGMLAGLGASYEVGLIGATAYEFRKRKILNAISRARHSAQWIRKAYRPRAGLWSLPKRDTFLCRCEDITFGEAEDALRLSDATPYIVKTLTGVGMGYCQGRTCGDYLIEWLRAHHGFRLQDSDRPWRIRPPIRSVPLGEWLATEGM